MYASNPRVVMAYKISSPVIVFLFSCMHRSFALWTVKEMLQQINYFYFFEGNMQSEELYVLFLTTILTTYINPMR